MVFLTLALAVCMGSEIHRGAIDIKLLSQIKDEEWGGAFVDILPRTPIPDKSHIRGFVLPSSATSSSPTSADEPMVNKGGSKFGVWTKE